MLDMAREEIGAFLKQQETGVLSMCSEGEAYGVPESFGYRNGRLYFLLDLTPNSEKRAFIDETDTVCFTVYAANSARDFASVVVRGTLDKLPENGSAAELAVGENEQFPSSHVFPEGDSLVAYELVASEISGRKGPDFETDEVPEIPATTDS